MGVVVNRSRRLRWPSARRNRGYRAAPPSSHCLCVLIHGSGPLPSWRAPRPPAFPSLLLLLPRGRGPRSSCDPSAWNTELSGSSAKERRRWRPSRSSSHSPSSQRQRQPIHLETNHGLLPVLPRQPSLVPHSLLRLLGLPRASFSPALSSHFSSSTHLQLLRRSVQFASVRCGGQREKRRRSTAAAAARSSTLSTLPRPTAALKRSGRCEGGLSPLPQSSE